MLHAFNFLNRCFELLRSYVHLLIWVDFVGRMMKTAMLKSDIVLVNWDLLKHGHNE